MNKNFFVSMTAAALLFLGAGCMPAKPFPAPEPDTVEPQPVPSPTVSATGPPEVKTGALHVTWSAPVSIDPVDVFTASYEAYNPNVNASGNTEPEYVKKENYHQVGVVKDGDYAGGRVVLVNMSIRCGMGGSGTPYHFVLPVTGKPVMLAKHSPTYAADTSDPSCSDFDPGKFVIDTTAQAPELTLPGKLAHAGSDFKLVQSSFWNSFDLQVGTPLLDTSHKKIAFTDPAVGKIYMDADDAENPQHGFYAAAPDGTVRSYALVVPFYDENLHLPAITWSDGTKNAKEYWLTRMGGCGAQNYANVFKGVTKAELKAAGTTAQGGTIYLLKDENSQILKDIYTAYAPTYEGRDTSQDVPYADVVKSRPIFFWYDSFGRLIGFQGTQFMSAAECGKPVIYLYPPTTQDVNVKLDPQGGFTKSEPAYADGWNVRATPKGALTDLKDGKTYPYLFWEGRGGLYETPKRGFNVARQDVHAFLTEKLSKLGLNRNESADFMEFWEPRMQGAPYYFVTFLGNRAMDALAPMRITPKPDSVIRILMDFRPLAAPIDVQGFDIHTPKRDGFTVVEWGGVLR